MNAKVIQLLFRSKS